MLLTAYLQADATAESLKIALRLSADLETCALSK